ncbi:MAG: YggS family pyridoxal phosphate enzyme, partial [Dietzia sp.]|nr:YggS family pyridoxal phosphate enzyme [Dietzia sp.]
AAALRRDHPDAVEFSAGMSGDIEEAIAAGSTCVRVGTAILGPRPVV